MRVAGIDGTKHGWVIVCHDENGITGFASGDLVGAWAALQDYAAVGIDMPIGLPEAAERGGRLCEKLAREAMPGRSSCVFNSPARAALDELDYVRASEINRRSSVDGLGLAKQSFALFQKMREVDGVASPETQARLFEVHPELSFSILARRLGHSPPASKRSYSGLKARVELLQAAGFDPEPLMLERRSLRASEDDILDAAAAAWTAQRKALGEALRFPAEPPTDARGLFMEMWA